MRVEQDMIGCERIPDEAYYGLQTLRAVQNFQITGRGFIPQFIESLVLIKKAAALVNAESGRLDSRRAEAIVWACDEILEGKYRDQFVTDAVQGGAGTSVNMNANEVISNRAIELLGGRKGDYALVHPNDHVNMSQSTNDVVPTAGKLTLLRLMGDLLPALEALAEALGDREREFEDIIKMGRTQLQDAVPIRLGREFGAYRRVVERDIRRLRDALDEIRTINMGGTAIGTRINANPYYVENIAPTLDRLTGTGVRRAEDLVDATQNLDGFVAVSAALRTCAVSLSKMSNDLRLMSSGPRAGLGEINLPPRQNGSSIMPGKVNPVIPEVVTQVAFGIIGNDVTVSMAAEAGQMELNAFEPILFDRLFESALMLTGAVKTFTEHCVKGITANRERCGELVERSVGIITALCPHIGYTAASAIAKQAIRNGTSVREELMKQGILTEAQIEEYLDIQKMA